MQFVYWNASRRNWLEIYFFNICFSEDSTLKKSQGSLESSTKSEEEGSDSLGAYEDVDPTKFNDEGSFVDQAGYKRPLIASEAKPHADFTSPSALTAFV